MAQAYFRLKIVIKTDRLRTYVVLVMLLVCYSPGVSQDAGTVMFRALQFITIVFVLAVIINSSSFRQLRGLRHPYHRHQVYPPHQDQKDHQLNAVAAVLPRNSYFLFNSRTSYLQSCSVNCFHWVDFDSILNLCLP